MAKEEQRDSRRDELLAVYDMGTLLLSNPHLTKLFEDGVRSFHASNDKPIKEGADLVNEIIFTIFSSAALLIGTAGSAVEAGIEILAKYPSGQNPGKTNPSNN